MRRIILVALCVLSLASISQAAMLAPAWRGDAGTTYQEWGFSTDANPVDADIYDNIYGTPIAEINPITGGTEWKADDFFTGHTGVWLIERGSKLNLIIPNTDNTGPETSKEIWMNIIYSASGIPEFLTDPMFANIELIQHENLGSGYWHDVIKFTLEDNPTEETITIQPRDCTLYVDSIAIDTICIPEPATMSLLGLAGLALRIKRKK